MRKISYIFSQSNDHFDNRVARLAFLCQLSQIWHIVKWLAVKKITCWHFSLKCQQEIVIANQFKICQIWESWHKIANLATLFDNISLNTSSTRLETNAKLSMECIWPIRTQRVTKINPIEKGKIPYIIFLTQNEDDDIDDINNNNNNNNNDNKKNNKINNKNEIYKVPVTKNYAHSLNRTKDISWK